MKSAACMQLENDLAVVFDEIQIITCVIHYKVLDCAEAPRRNPELISPYAVNQVSSWG